MKIYTLFRSLFKGREDVFALHWKNGTKSGYMPAFLYDPYRYRVHKMKGGTFESYTDKTHLPFTDDQLIKHLNGEQLIGIYPLLKDNTSWFIAADFDKQNWIADCRKFLDCCKAENIPAYLERSRSGNGGHVWIFFSAPYAAVKSRKIILSLLIKSNAISAFDKSSSFDRLFPNQDMLSGKGLGNLIALPLYKPALEQGNSCFIDPETLLPIPDQWEFLSTIQKANIEQLDEIYRKVSAIKASNEAGNNEQGNANHLTISINNTLQLNKIAIPLSLTNFLRKELNFANSEFIIKKKSGKNTFGTERYFRFVEETGQNVFLPRGFARKLLQFCRDAAAPYTFEDQRKRKPVTLFKFQSELKNYQIPAFEATRKKDMGVIVALTRPE